MRPHRSLNINSIIFSGLHFAFSSEHGEFASMPSNSFLKVLPVRHYEIDIMVEFITEYSELFDFDVIAEQMEFFVGDCYSWMDLVDTILYHGNAAFVAFRYLLVVEMTTAEAYNDGCNCVTSTLEDVRRVLFPKTEIYQLVTRSSSLAFTKFRSLDLFATMDGAVQFIKVWSGNKYLSGVKHEGQHPLIESTPIVQESKADFFTEYLPVSSKYDNIYIPSREWNKISN